MSDDDVKLDELFSSGLKAAARPHTRAAVAHRDALLSPADKGNGRGLHSGVSFAAAHRRLLAALAAAAVFTGVAALALPNLQSGGRAKINPSSTPTTDTNTNGSTVPRRGKGPGGTNGTGPGSSNGPAGPGGGVAGGSEGSFSSPDGTTNGDPAGGGAPGGSSTGGTTGRTTGSTAPVLDTTAAPYYTIANHLTVVLYDDGFRDDQLGPGLRGLAVGEGVSQIGLQDHRTHPVGKATLAIGGHAIAAGSYAQFRLNVVDQSTTGIAYVDGKPIGASVAIWPQVKPFWRTPTKTDQKHPNGIEATLGAGGFTLTACGFSTVDQPYYHDDPLGQLRNGIVWTTLVLPAGQRASLYLTVNDNLAHKLTIRSMNGGAPWRDGDLSARSHGKDFTLPPTGVGAPHNKYVLEYSMPGGPPVTLVIYLITAP